jgi:hypothetical protein
MKKVFVSMLPVVLLCGTWSKGAAAQTSSTSQPATQFAGWDVSKKDAPDVTVVGVVQQVVSNQTAGAPSGLHLMLGTLLGVVDASVGQFLPPQVQKALVAGKQVQVIGRVQSIHDQNYLLARVLVVDGEKTEIRNDHGSLVHTKANERTYSQTGQNDQNGGRQ